MFPIGRRCAPPSAGTVAALLASVVGAPGTAQQNLSFETLDPKSGFAAGWTAGGGSDDSIVTSDERRVAAGQRSLRITRTAPGGATRLVQRVAAAKLRATAAGRTLRVRLRGAVLAEGAARPALWLRIDGPRGPLYLDTFGEPREPGPGTAGSGYGDSGGLDWRRPELELPLPDDVEELAFGVSVRGEGAAWFDDLTIAVIAVDDAPAPAPAAVRYLDAALALLRQHALMGVGVDWNLLRTNALAHARGARTAADAHLAVRYAVRELGDRHSYLQSPAATRTLAAATVSNARTGVPPAAPRGERLDVDLGYLAIPGFAGGTPSAQVEFAESLRNLIQHIDSRRVCGWVVDLRQNSGGNLWPMLAGLGALLGEGELAASVYPDGRRVPIWQRAGQAGFGDYTQLRVREPYRLRAPAPVAVLLGPGTASSAEVLAVALRGRPATRTFGAATRGLSAGNRTFALADGASLVLTVAATSDRDGAVLLGPLNPDEPVARASRGSPDEPDAALAAAVRWLEGEAPCR